MLLFVVLNVFSGLRYPNTGVVAANASSDLRRSVILFTGLSEYFLRLYDIIKDVKREMDKDTAHALIGSLTQIAKEEAMQSKFL